MYTGQASSAEPDTPFDYLALPLHTGGDPATILNPEDANCFFLNFGLLEPPSPGDFLPVGQNISQGTACLVPARGDLKPTNWNGLSRATLFGAVDLVTGVPLVRSTDLHLPFGGAEFRLTRTRSARPSFLGSRWNYPWDGDVSPVDTAWWDWAGSGWMLSENPLFIVDSHVPDQISKADGPRCWLWLDAFHSIPFDWVVDDQYLDPSGPSGDYVVGHYDCAPRFRAKLTVIGPSNNVAPRRYTSRDGASNPRAGEWIEGYYPTRFIVSLYDGELTYEFVPVWEDVPNWEYQWPANWSNCPTSPPSSQITYSSMHGLPQYPVSTTLPEDHEYAAWNPWLPQPLNGRCDWLQGSTHAGPRYAGRGVGMPHYALLKSVRDRAGNRAEMTYSRISQWVLPGTAKTFQWTTQKGMLTEIRLFESGSSSPRWTIIHTYRLVPRTAVAVRPGSGSSTTAFDHTWNLAAIHWSEAIAASDPVLETTYAFEGNVDTGGVSLVRSPFESFWRSGQGDTKRWPTNDNDLLERYRANADSFRDRMEMYYGEESPAPVTPDSLSNSQKQWKFRCRYYYASSDLPNARGYSLGPGLLWSNSDASSVEAVTYPPMLVRTSVEENDAATIRTHKTTVFQYKSQGPVVGDTPRLTDVFDDDGIARVHSKVRSQASRPASLDGTLKDLMSGVVWAYPSTDFESGMSEADFHDAARVSFVYDPSLQATTQSLVADGILREQPPAQGGSAPDPAATYFHLPANGVPKAVAFTDSRTGSKRYFRISLAIRSPRERTTTVNHSSLTSLAENPMRSVFLSPFRWQTYAQASGEIALYKWPDIPSPFSWNYLGSNYTTEPCATEYDTHRFVSVVDEFSSWNDLQQAYQRGEAGLTSFFTKSVSRRVVGLNPLGNLLFEKTYVLDNGVPVAQDGTLGLTEELVYKSGEDILREIKGLGTSGSLSSLNPVPTASFLTERFLVERKSIGYAAAKGSSTDPVPNQGLIDVLSYQDVWGGAASDTPPAWSERVRVVATGIKRGDSGSVFFNNLAFFEKWDPTLSTGGATFLEPREKGAFPATPAAALADSLSSVTETRTIRVKDNGDVVREEQWSVSGRRQDPDGGNYRDVSVVVMGRNGLPVWDIQAVADVTIVEPTTSGGSAQVAVASVKSASFGYHQYDSFGREVRTWLDVDPNAMPALVGTVTTSVPAAISSRVNPSGASALARMTERRYGFGGLTDIIYPSGRRWAKRWIFYLPDASEPSQQINSGMPYVRCYTFTDLFPTTTGPNATMFMSLAEGTVTDYRDIKDQTSPFVTPSFDSEENMSAPSRGYGKPPVLVMLRMLTVKFAGDIALDGITTEASTQPSFVAQQPIQLAYDSSGRLNRVASLEPTANGTVAAEATILENGDRLTVTAMDGTITRRLRNALGQITKTYVGTISTGTRWDDDAIPDQSPVTDTNCYDMVLRERVSIGNGPTDARQITKRWTYLNRPTWQEPSANGGNQANPYADGPADDPEGELTQATFDWRMRLVRTDVLAPNGTAAARPRLRATLSYLDFASRPVIEASYGEAVPELGSDDPEDMEPGETLNASRRAAIIRKLLGAAPATTSEPDTRPLSLTEMIYNPDGTVKEKRTYRAPAAGYSPSSSSTPLQYHSEIFFYGAGGREIVSQRPSSPARSVVLDNLGRVFQERTVLPKTTTVNGVTSTAFDYELSRTEYQYDSEGNTIVTDRWERINAPASTTTLGSDNALSTTNAIRTRTETWYDAANRVVMTADYGTGSSDNTLTSAGNSLPSITGITHPTPFSGNEPKLVVDSSSATPTYTAMNVPSATSSAKVIMHAYDEAGKKIATLSPTGVITAFTYDSKGRLKEQIEDATGLKRKTKYAYWLGRTIAVSSERIAGSTNTEQYQGVAYGAQVVQEIPGGDSKPTLKHISNNNALVGAMMSVNPDRLVSLSGTPLRIDYFDFSHPDFTYRYYADGLLAERIDKRGIAIRYFYDNHRRLRETEVWHYPITNDPATYPSGQPESRNLFALGSIVRGYPSWMGTLDGFDPEQGGIGGRVPRFTAPKDRIGYITYLYDARGNLAKVTCFTSRAASEANQIIAETKFDYDERDNLIKEYQAHGTTWQGTSVGDSSVVRTIDYTRTYAAAATSGAYFGGRDRLATMQYPTSSNTAGRRTVSFEYGTTTSLDHLLDRMVTFKTWNNTQTTSTVASLTYTADGRRSSLTLGGTSVISQSYDTNTSVLGLEGLSRFGEIKELSYKANSTNANIAGLWKGVYTYDLGGDRLAEVLTQRSVDGAGLSVNIRSRRFEYDALNRLSRVDHGVVSSDPTPSVSSIKRTEAWRLDQLGNWSGDNGGEAPASSWFTPSSSCTWSGAAAGAGIENNPNRGPAPTGTPPSGDFAGVFGHVVWGGLESSAPASMVLQETDSVADGYPGSAATSWVQWPQPDTTRRRLTQNPSTNAKSWTGVVTDLAGNVVYDGEYFYQYDAWNRLIQVNKDGVYATAADHLDWRFFDYRGVPWSRDDANGVFLPSCPTNRVGPLLKQFNHDGLGRLIRTSTPMSAAAFGEGYNFSGNPTATRSERFFYDGLRRVQELVTNPVLMNEEGDVVSLAGEVTQNGQSNSNQYVRAEYIWGPGDAQNAGVYELFAQYDSNSKPWYVLQDAQGDIIAILEKPSGSTPAKVVQQWNYSPYGQVISTERFATSTGEPVPTVVFGHKGLAVDRLDTPSSSWDSAGASLLDTRRLESGARLLAYANNRTLDVSRGRWLQQDPNASGLPVNAAILFHGIAPATPVVSIELAGRMRDGLALGNYCRNGPISASDLSGLMIDAALRAPNGMQTLYTGLRIAGWIKNLSDIAYIGGITTIVAGPVVVAGAITVHSVMTYGVRDAGLYGRDKLADTGYGWVSPGERQFALERRALQSSGRSSGSGNVAGGDPNQPERPERFTHSKHHPNSESPEPKDAGSVYDQSVTIDNGRTWWGLSSRNQVYRYQASNNQAHWNGQTGVGRGLKVPQEVWELLGQSGRPPR